MCVLGTSFGIWVVLVVVAQLIDPEKLFDVRYWISNAVVMGATAGPSLLFPLVFERDTNRAWLIIFGLACAIFGTLAFPVAAIYTVCGLGIDCL